ncbi:MAG: glycosyltransferase family 2 protein [Erysipelotrichaceae bacterium]|nr:glycosyltransferase family 2 protein [Erysipelotrichaceae bacterium]
MKTLFVISACIVVMFGIYALYFLIHAFRNNTEDSYNTKECDRKHFAILIPARNEESVIGSLLESVSRLDYPKDLYDTYVLINDCTDDTEKIAASFDAVSLYCNTDTGTKGTVLEAAFGLLKDHDEADAYVIIDADNAVHPQFLEEMNRMMGTDASVIQGKRTGKLPLNTWIAQCYEIFYSFINSFFNVNGNNPGRTATINGSGWAVSRELIDEMDFRLVTITEDYEFSIICALNDKKIVYCDKAVVYDSFTATFRTSLIQRLRWTYGIIQCFRKYLKALFAKARKGSLACFDIAMTCIMALFIACFMVALFITYGYIFSFLPFIIRLLIIIAAFWVPVCAYAAIAVKKNGKRISELKKGIICFPLFLISWFPILVYCLFLRECKWTQLRRS